MAVWPAFGRVGLYDLGGHPITFAALFESADPLHEQHFPLPCDHVTLMLALESQLAKRLRAAADSMNGQALAAHTRMPLAYTAPAIVASIKVCDPYREALQGMSDAVAHKLGFRRPLPPTHR
jgi:hypothetical protein